MKQILFLALVAIMSLQGVYAQRNGGHKRTPEQIVERLDKKLDLTDEQEKQITDLYKNFFSQGKVAREERKAKMDELKSNISKLLNDEQKAKYEKMQSSQKVNKKKG